MKDNDDPTNDDKKNKVKHPPTEPIDPYTGEVEPPAEDAYKVIEIMPVESEESIYLSQEEEPMDTLAADAQADAVAEQMTRFTQDEGIKEEFEERQQWSSPGRGQLKDELEEHHFQTPEISGGDLDAAWEDSVQAGDEAVGGSISTPDQDTVEGLGAAVGLEYEDDEPLQTEEKFLQRDRERWELNPESADDEDENA